MTVSFLVPGSSMMIVVNFTSFVPRMLSYWTSQTLSVGGFYLLYAIWRDFKNKPVTLNVRLGRWSMVYLSVLLLLPLAALFQKAGEQGITTFWEVATDPIACSAYAVTLGLGLQATLLNTFFGSLVAWVLVRYRFPGRRLLDAAVDLPFALPTSVAGLTIVTVYGDHGVFGPWLELLGLKVAFTRIGVTLAMVFVSFPFVVRAVQPVLRDLEPELEEASMLLGASFGQTFFRVLLPTLTPSLLTGAALGFSRAVGEYGSVVIVASNIPFRDLTAPVLIFQYLEQYNYTGATVVGTVILFASLLILLVINAIQQYGDRARKGF